MYHILPSTSVIIWGYLPSTPIGRRALLREKKQYTRDLAFFNIPQGSLSCPVYIADTRALGFKLDRRPEIFQDELTSIQKGASVAY